MFACTHACASTPCMRGGGGGRGEWKEGRKESSPPATSLTRIQS